MAFAVILVVIVLSLIVLPAALFWVILSLISQALRNGWQGRLLAKVKVGATLLKGAILPPAGTRASLLARARLPVTISLRRVRQEIDGDVLLICATLVLLVAVGGALEALFLQGGTAATLARLALFVIGLTISIVGLVFTLTLDDQFQDLQDGDSGDGVQDAQSVQDVLSAQFLEPVYDASVQNKVQ